MTNCNLRLVSFEFLVVIFPIFVPKHYGEFSVTYIECVLQSSPDLVIFAQSSPRNRHRYRNVDIKIVIRQTNKCLTNGSFILRQTYK